MNLHQPYEIDIKTLDEFPATVKRPNFFELIYISDGAGLQHTNGLNFTYRKGNLFLITPQDNYSFEIVCLLLLRVFMPNL